MSNYAGAADTTAGAANPNMNASEIDSHQRAVSYTCGDCDQDVQLRRGEPIRCRNCGHRVLYKKRTNRMVQFEAR
ncbi:hypothetical protein DM02DRAFT_647798 [Periconia macrospinosa]|uniref:Metallothionein-I gene transcription activator n=1 Tax=Periconia macrospinosa TaxID=97972 RepID=A0A2V1ED21_9PLEO|nr:hypothetical protein DM02DRAFT_647798 [Periconia macrospinosa]